MSGLNTALIVLLIILLVGFGSYLYVQNEKEKMNSDDGSIQLQIGGTSDN